MIPDARHFHSHTRSLSLSFALTLDRAEGYADIENMFLIVLALTRSFSSREIPCPHVEQCLY